MKWFKRKLKKYAFQLYCPSDGSRDVATIEAKDERSARIGVMISVNPSVWVIGPAELQK